MSRQPEALRLANVLDSVVGGALCNRAAAELRRLHAECEALREELETERMRVVACGVVADADTPDSAAKARDMHPDYRSPSCDDVARLVDECISLRAENEALRADAERYRWLRHGDNDEPCLYFSDDCKAAVWLLREDELDAAIDATRAALKETK